MNYDDYYAQQVGGALPYFAGARVQRGHGFGSLFAGLLRSVAPLIKRGALALGNRALKTARKLLVMYYRVRISGLRRNGGRILREEICYRVCSRHRPANASNELHLVGNGDP